MCPSRSEGADATMDCMGGPPEGQILSTELRVPGQSSVKAVLFADCEQGMASAHAAAHALDVKLSCFLTR